MIVNLRGQELFMVSSMVHIAMVVISTGYISIFIYLIRQTV